MKYQFNMNLFKNVSKKSFSKFYLLFVTKLESSDIIFEGMPGLVKKPHENRKSGNGI